MPSRFKDATPYVWPTLEEVRAERLRAPKKHTMARPPPLAPPLAAALDISPAPSATVAPRPTAPEPAGESSSVRDKLMGISDWG